MREVRWKVTDSKWQWEIVHLKRAKNQGQNERIALGCHIHIRFISEILPSNPPNIKCCAHVSNVLCIEIHEAVNLLHNTTGSKTISRIKVQNVLMFDSSVRIIAEYQTYSQVSL